MDTHTKKTTPFLPGRGSTVSLPPFQTGGPFVSEKTLSVNVHRQLPLEPLTRRLYKYILIITIANHTKYRNKCQLNELSYIKLE